MDRAMELLSVCFTCRISRVHQEGQRTCGTCQQPFTVVQREQLVGGRFVLGMRIGVGSMGVVHMGQDIERGEGLRVAIKLLHPRYPAPDALAAINHPHVVTVLGSGTHEGRSYVAMDLLEGESLKARLAKGGLGLAAAFRLWTQLVKGMAKAHQLGIQHRDLKPGNIFLEPAPGEALGLIKIVDFGLANVRGRGLGLGAGSLAGTLEYMAPEQLDGKPATSASDVYALGLLFLEMASGQPPRVVADHFVSVLFRAYLHRTTTPRRLGELFPEASAPLQQLLAEVLAEDPAARPPDALRLLDRLQALEPLGVLRGAEAAGPARGRASQPAAAPPEQARGDLARSFWRRVVPWAAGAVLVASAATAGTVWWRLGRGGAPATGSAAVVPGPTPLPVKEPEKPPPPTPQPSQQMAEFRAEAPPPQLQLRCGGRVVCGRWDRPCRVPLTPGDSCVASSPGCTAQTYSRALLATRAGPLLIRLKCVQVPPPGLLVTFAAINPPDVVVRCGTQACRPDPLKGRWTGPCTLKLQAGDSCTATQANFEPLAISAEQLRRSKGPIRIDLKRTFKP